MKSFFIFFLFIIFTFSRLSVNHRITRHLFKQKLSDDEILEQSAAALDDSNIMPRYRGPIFTDLDSNEMPPMEGHEATVYFDSEVLNSLRDMFITWYGGNEQALVNDVKVESYSSSGPNLPRMIPKLFHFALDFIPEHCRTNWSPGANGNPTPPSAITAAERQGCEAHMPKYEAAMKFIFNKFPIDNGYKFRKRMSDYITCYTKPTLAFMDSAPAATSCVDFYAVIFSIATRYSAVRQCDSPRYTKSLIPCGLNGIAYKEMSSSNNPSLPVPSAWTSCVPPMPENVRPLPGDLIVDWKTPDHPDREDAPFQHVSFLRAIRKEDGNEYWYKIGGGLGGNAGRFANLGRGTIILYYYTTSHCTTSHYTIARFDPSTCITESPRSGGGDIARKEVHGWLNVEEHARIKSSS